MEAVRKLIAHYLVNGYSDSDNDRRRLNELRTLVGNEPKVFMGIVKKIIPADQLKVKLNLVPSDKKRGLQLAKRLMEKLATNDDHSLEMMQTLYKLTTLGIVNDLSVVQSLYHFDLEDCAEDIIGFASRDEDASEAQEEKCQSVAVAEVEEECIAEGAKYQERTEHPPPHPVPLTNDIIKHLCEARLTHKRNAQPMKASRTDPQRSEYSLQVQRNVIRLMNRFPVTAKLWRLPETIAFVVQEFNKPEVVRVYLSSLASLIRVLTVEEHEAYFGTKETYEANMERLKEIQHEFRTKIEENDKQQLPRERQEAPMTWSALCKIVEQQRIPEAITNKEDLAAVRATVLVRLYTIDNDPRRLELTWLRWKNYDEKRDNYYDTTTREVVLNEYKTVMKHKPYIFKVTEATHQGLVLISNYLTATATANEYIFGLDNPNHGTNVMYSAFQKVCGHSLSCQVLRKMRIEQAHNNGELKYFTERVALAARMGHSVEDQQILYTVRPKDPGSEKVEVGRKAALFPNATQIEAIKEAISGRCPIDKVSWKKMVARDPDVFKGVPKRTIRNWGYTLLKKTKPDDKK